MNIDHICEVCGGHLGSEVTQLDIMRGSLTVFVNGDSKIVVRPAGQRHYSICERCEAYFVAAMAYLRGLLAVRREAA